MRLGRAVYIPALAALGVTYSALFPVNRLSVEAGLPYLGYVFWFSLVGTVVLALLAAARRELPRFSFPHLRAYVVLGALGVVLPVPLLTFVAPKLPVGIITLLLILVPLFTYVLSYLVGIERLRLTGVVGVLLGLVGILFVLVPEVSLPSRDMVGWVLLAMLAPWCFAGANTMAVYLRPPASPALAMATGALGSATVLLLPVMLAAGHGYMFPGPTMSGLVAVLLAAAISVVVKVGWFVLVAIVGAVYFSQFNYFIVLGGFGWGMALYGEQHSVYVWLAAGLTFLGLAIFSRGAAIAARAPA